MKKSITVGCIGCGVMGGALIKAITKTVTPESVFVLDLDMKKTKELHGECGCTPTANYQDFVAQKPDYILLAVKPAYMKSTLEEYQKATSYLPKAFISVAAGLSIETLNSYLPHTFVRLMPNIPALVGEGMIGLSRGNATDEIVADVMEILSQAGILETVPEKLMDAVTAISGSGPAYVCLFIEALADAAVKFGMPRKQAYTYAAQTLKGTATMILEKGIHPAQLKDDVCSPSGTTIEGVQALEEAGFRAAVIKGAEATWLKSISMGKKS